MSNIIHRNLRAHENLIKDVIRRQAGSLEKATLEAVMNAIEAGSPTVSITLEHEGIEAYKPGAFLIIQDQGRGFRNAQEIQDWFETFGTPHTESEGKIWAQFRMGRGQCFAFGRNVWRTGEFRMMVDVEKNGLEYELETGLEHFHGCRIEIELYHNPIGGSYGSVDTLKSAIKRQIEFMEGTITFNGERLNTPASLLKWDVEDDDAYYSFGFGTGATDLTYYNLGAFVMTQPASQAGVTGIVVSKRQFKVNFARNDIQHDCAVYARVREIVQANRMKKVRAARRTLDSNERIALLRDLRDGEVQYSEIRGLNLVGLSNDKMMTLDKIRQIRQPWSVARQGDLVADRLQYLDQAVVFDEELLDLLDYPQDKPASEFFVWLMRAAISSDRRSRGDLESQWEPMRRFYRELSNLGAGISRTKTILPREKWTPAESRIVRALERYSDVWKGRSITIGVSDTARAWTDGSTFIALARDYLREYNPNSVYGASHVVMTMLHEVAHDDSTEDSHHHGMEFYKHFHDLVRGACTNSSYGAAYIMLDLQKMMKRVKVEDWNEKIFKKNERVKARREKKLGLNEVRIAACHKPSEPVKVLDDIPEIEGEPVVKGCKKKRRLRRI